MPHRTERRARHGQLPPLVALLSGAVLAVSLAVPAAAEVVIETRPDGSKLVRNVGGPSPSSAAPAARRPTLRSAPRAELDRAVDDAAAAEGLDPRLVKAVIQAESGWNRLARSRKGAMGLMQLMPETAVVLAVDDPWDELQNVRGGVAYLARLLARFGDLGLALAAYNAGPSAVERHGGIPPYAETRAYVQRVLSLYQGREVGAAELASPSPSRGPSPRLEPGPEGRLKLTNAAAARR